VIRITVPCWKALLGRGQTQAIDRYSAGGPSVGERNIEVFSMAGVLVERILGKGVLQI
jgi:hypothetical protein